MATNYMETTMDALMQTLGRLNAAEGTDAIESECKRARTVMGVAEQVFDGQRTNNETCRLQMDMQRQLAPAAKPKVIRKLAAPKSEPYYAKQREAMDATENQEFYGEVVTSA